MKEASADLWFCRVIQHVCVSSACRQLAESDRQVANGMNKVAEKHSQDASRLMLSGMAATATAAPAMRRAAN